jgi:hypothetical protein
MRAKNRAMFSRWRLYWVVFYSNKLYGEYIKYIPPKTVCSVKRKKSGFVSQRAARKIVHGTGSAGAVWVAEGFPNLVAARVTSSSRGS